jgi:AcrR family transcriptional regulator
MTTQTKRRKRALHPLGRDEVRPAIIAAARTLFAERGYAAVSVRDIAALAKVNHGLVHRHFGSKDAVLHAVLQGMFEGVSVIARAKLSPSAPDFAEQLYPLAAARKQDWQILMRAVLDGFDFQTAGFKFPLTTAVMEHVASQRGTRNEEARAIAGAIIAGGLGWLLLETYLAPILDLDRVDHDKLRKRMGALFQRLVDA